MKCYNPLCIDAIGKYEVLYHIMAIGAIFRFLLSHLFHIFSVALPVHIFVNSYWFHWGSLKGRSMDSEAQKYCSCSVSLSIVIQLHFFLYPKLFYVFYPKHLNPSEIFFYSFLGPFDYVLCLFSMIIFI